MSANVDQKRVLKFNSLEAFNAVSSTLEYPGLFMIGDTNSSDIDGTQINRTAARGSIDKIIDAEYGDILMVNVNTNKMSCVTSESYNLSDYPAAEYTPIAVCICDKESNENGNTIFLSVQVLDTAHIGTGVKSSNGVSIGDMYETLNVEAIHSFTSSSKTLNDQMKSITTGLGQHDAFYVCWKFATVGTKEGDWMLPSYSDIKKYKNDSTSPIQSFTKIKDLMGTDYIKYAGSEIWIGKQKTSSAEYSTLNELTGAVNNERAGN